MAGAKTPILHSTLDELEDRLAVGAMVGFRPGKVWWVDSNAGSNSNTGESSSDALATLQAAINKCEANKGHVIALKPGHAETVASAGAITFTATSDAGITVVGMGYGAARPTFTFTTAVGADIEVDADSITFINILFKSGITALTGPLDIDGADFTMLNCEWFDDSTYATVDCVVCSGARPRIENCWFDLEDTAAGGNDSAIQLNGCTNAKIINNRIYGTLQAGGIEDATVSTGLLIEGNDIESTHADDVCITLQATSTGTIRYNTLRIATDAQTSWITAGNDCNLYENYGVNLDQETGVLVGVASA